MSQRISPLTGILSRFEKLRSGPDLCIYAAQGSQIWRPDFRGDFLLSNRMAVSGAGQTEMQARASCMGEAAERYSLQFHGDETRTRGRYRDMQPGAIDPRMLMQFSPGQYRHRALLNRMWSGLDLVPEPFDPDREIEWTAVQSLTGGQQRYVPTAHCYLGYGERFCGADTNGCAAGSVWEEAVLRGLLELVERDAVALWWYSRARRPAFAWETLGSGRVRSVVGLIANRRRVLHILDVTTDLHIPAFAAISSKSDGSAVLLGAGASLDPEAAIWSAVSELAKILLIREHPDHRRARFRGLSVLSTGKCPYLLPSPAPHKVQADYPSLARPTLRNHLKTCIHRLTALGFEAYALKATRPELGIPVARVIVPGLRHWGPRLAAGRLYEAPLAMGWSPKLKESELNPTPLFP